MKRILNRKPQDTHLLSHKIADRIEYHVKNPMPYPEVITNVRIVFQQIYDWLDRSSIMYPEIEVTSSDYHEILIRIADKSFRITKSIDDETAVIKCTTRVGLEIRIPNVDTELHVQIDKFLDELAEFIAFTIINRTLNDNTDR